MKVLFIGGTGNISTSVSRLCVSKGIDLYLLNRKKTNTNLNGVKQITADIHNLAEVSGVLKDHKWDVVVNWIAFTKEDVLRDIKLFNGKTSQYIFISSASIYEKPLSNYIVTESTPLVNPFWQYSRNKIICEEELNRAYHETGFPITIVRPSHTYDTIIPASAGGGNKYNIIHRLRNGKPIIVHGDGTSLWTLTHSVDFTKGFVGLIGNQKAIGESFHITSDESLTWDQIHTTIADALNVNANIVHIASDYLAEYDESFRGSLLGDKAYSVVFDNAKIKAIVPEFTCNIPFSEGIKQTIDWFESKPRRMVVDEDYEKMIDEILVSYGKTGAALD